MNDRTPNPTPPPSRPLTLLAVEDDGTLAAAWTVTAPTPTAALVMLGERATSTGLDGEARNPARWLVHDRTPEPAAFWAALDAGEISQPPGDALREAYRKAGDEARAKVFGRPAPDRHYATSPHAHTPVIHPAMAGKSYIRQLASTMGTPPTGLPMADRARWAGQYALIVQAPLMAHPRLRFHGLPGQMPGTGNVSITTASGGFLAPLANTGYAKSPSGFGWGGGTLGSGPAALAKALITAALGRYAACGECAGTGRVTWLDDPDDGQAGHRAWRPEDGTADSVLAVAACPACDRDGIGIPPAVYREYAAAQVASLPEDREWQLTRADVLAWLEMYSGDARLAGLARQVER